MATSSHGQKELGLLEIRSPLTGTPGWEVLTPHELTHLRFLLYISRNYELSCFCRHAGIISNT